MVTILVDHFPVVRPLRKVGQNGYQLVTNWLPFRRNGPTIDRKCPTFQKWSDLSKMVDHNGRPLVDQMVTNWSDQWSTFWPMVDHLAKWSTILLPTTTKNGRPFNGRHHKSRPFNGRPFGKTPTIEWSTICKMVTNWSDQLVTIWQNGRPLR